MTNNQNTGQVEQDKTHYSNRSDEKYLPGQALKANIETKLNGEMSERKLIRQLKAQKISKKIGEKSAQQ